MTIHSALLQSGEDFWEGHGCGHDTKAFVSRDVDWVFHCAHFQALQIIGCVDRALAVGHVAHAVLAPSQGFEAFGLELFEHVLANLAIEHCSCMCFVAEEERNVQNTRAGHEVRHRASRGEGQLLRAQLHRFNALALAAQCARVEGLNLVAASGALFNFAGEGVNCHALVRILCHRDADTHGGLCSSVAHQACGCSSGEENG